MSSSLNLGRLEIDGLAVAFQDGADAVKATSFSLAPGERALLAGAAASGKSTLLAASIGVVPRLVRPSSFAGSVALDGIQHRDRSQADLFRAVGAVVQNLDDQMWDLAVEDVIAFPLENRAVPRDRVRRRMAVLIERLRLQELLGRRVLTLSGGERRMVALAAALAAEPPLVVLDEPTTGLDPSARARLAAALARDGAHRATLLVAEQDPRSLEQVVDRVLFQRDGAIIADMAGPAASADRAIWGRIGLLPPVHTTGRTAGARPGDTLLIAEGLTTALRRANGRPVLENLTVALQAGEVTGIVGANGTGKTTFFKSLLGLTRLTAGRIVIAGEDATLWTTARRARRIGYLPQDVRRLLFNLTLADEVAFAETGDPRRIHEPAVHERAIALLARVGLQDKAETSPFALSARQQSALGLACLEAADSRIVILDEPLLARDTVYRHLLDTFVDRAREAGRTVVLVSHDLDLVDAMADRLLILRDGKIAYDGQVRDGWNAPAFLELGWPAPVGPEEPVQ